MVSIIAKENRIMISAIKCDIKEMKVDVKNMSNHYSRRLPVWASVLFMILTAILGGLIGRLVL